MTRTTTVTSPAIETIEAALTEIRMAVYALQWIALQTPSLRHAALGEIATVVAELHALRK